MRWIALRWPAECLGAGMRLSLAWQALVFTPHVAWAGDTLLLEVAACASLWGGRQVLLRRLLAALGPDDAPARCAQGASSLVALARARLQLMAPRSQSRRQSADRRRVSRYRPRVRDLPLATLDAAQPHLPVLARLGCRTWGDVAALPRAGVARRFGADLVRALDIAWGRAPDAHEWIVPPERFDESLELPHRVDTAPALLWSGNRLLLRLQQWLRARNRGVLALELAWTFDQLRLNGRTLPPAQSMTLHTAEPAQGMDHIQRLLAIRLERTTLLAPAHTLRLRVLETARWQAPTTGFLPENAPRGQALHFFLERVLARLGPQGALLGAAANDYRMEGRQRWLPVERAAKVEPWAMPGGAWPDFLGPAWLLRAPRVLRVSSGHPMQGGKMLDLLAGPRRIESGWWSGPVLDAPAPVARDYFIARGNALQLLLLYRERATAVGGAHAGGRWFLQGIYA